MGLSKSTGLLKIKDLDSFNSSATLMIDHSETFFTGSSVQGGRGKTKKESLVVGSVVALIFLICIALIAVNLSLQTRVQPDFAFNSTLFNLSRDMEAER